MTASNNMATCTTDVTVIDDIPPTVVCEDITIQYTDPDVQPGDVTTSISDNCSIASTVLSQFEFDCADVGDNDITVTVTDVNGLATMCTAIVTVEDNVPPVASAQDITVEVGATGLLNINPFDANVGSSDICDNMLNFSVSPPTCLLYTSDAADE